MSSKKLHLKIVTPEEIVLDESVEQVTLPTTEGEITILPDHVPLVAGLKSGDIVALSGGEHVPMAVAGGFVEVKQDADGGTLVAVLADFAEHVSKLTEDVLGRIRTRAEELKKRVQDKEAVDFEHFEAELEKSLTRLKVAEKWGNRKYRR